MARPTRSIERPARIGATLAGIVLAALLGGSDCGGVTVEIPSGTPVKRTGTVLVQATGVPSGPHTVEFWLETNTGVDVLYDDDDTPPYEIGWDVTTADHGVHHVWTATVKDGSGLLVAIDTLSTLVDLRPALELSVTGGSVQEQVAIGLRTTMDPSLLEYVEGTLLATNLTFRRNGEALRIWWGDPAAPPGVGGYLEGALKSPWSNVASFAWLPVSDLYDDVGGAPSSFTARLEVDGLVLESDPIDLSVAIPAGDYDVWILGDSNASGLLTNSFLPPAPSDPPYRLNALPTLGEPGASTPAFPFLALPTTTSEYGAHWVPVALAEPGVTAPRYAFVNWAGNDFVGICQHVDHPPPSDGYESYVAAEVATVIANLVSVAEDLALAGSKVFLSTGTGAYDGFCDEKTPPADLKCEAQALCLNRGYSDAGTEVMEYVRNTSLAVWDIDFSVPPQDEYWLEGIHLSKLGYDLVKTRVIGAILAHENP